MNCCPICGTKLYHNIWNGELGLEETIERCKNIKCGKYYNSWAYGTREIKLGKWESGSFTDHRFMNDKQILISDRSYKEFNLRLKYFNRRRIKHGS